MIVVSYDLFAPQSIVAKGISLTIAPLVTVEGGLSDVLNTTPRDHKMPAPVTSTSMSSGSSVMQSVSGETVH